tara:strand:- start:1680 stop:2762 length:1083 start_codon:yes stop_codon:yes gene_type:complete
MSDASIGDAQPQSTAIGDAAPSIDDTMAKAFDDIQERDAEDAAPAEEPAKADEAPAEDEDSPSVDGTPEAEPDDTDEPSDDGTDADTGDSQLDPPELWSEDAKASFNALDEAQKATVMDVTKAANASFTRKTQELAELRKQVEPLTGVLAQWEPYIRQLGTTAAMSFNTLMGAEYILRTGTDQQKREALDSIRKDYGISDGDSEDAYEDPEIASVKAELEKTKGHLQQLASGQTAARHQSIQQRVADFKSAVDDAGKQTHPHFDAVESTMAALLTSGQYGADDLEGAYEAAVYANPETRETVMGKVKSAEALKAKRTAKAKKAAAANRKSSNQPGAKPQVSGKWDDDDALGDIYDEAVGA